MRIKQFEEKFKNKAKNGVYLETNVDGVYINKNKIVYNDNEKEFLEVVDKDCVKLGWVRLPLDLLFFNSWKQLEKEDLKTFYEKIEFF